MIRTVIVALLALMAFSQDALAIYDPGTGRFITRDPAGYVDGMNLYRYGRANPVRYNDPSGLAPNWITRWIIRQFDNRWDVEDFIYHYYGPGGLRYDNAPFSPANLRFGTGDTVDLEEVGLADWYKNKKEIKERIKKCREKAKEIKDQMDSSNACESEDELDLPVGIEFEDTGVGFVMAKHQFKCNVKCKKENGKTECKIDYSVRDRFEDPADIPNKLPIDIEPGGTPYDIVYDWTEDY